MRDVNKVILIGRLGGDPIKRSTKTGTTVVNFSVATSRKVRAPGSQELPAAEAQWNEETQWHSVVVWGRQGEYCAQYLKKGHGVYLEGSLRSRHYESKEGSHRTQFEIHADDVSFLSRPFRKKSDSDSDTSAEEQGELQAG